MWSLCIGTFLVIGFLHWVYKWRNPICNGKLPPGSMGFIPIVGETLQFFTPYTTHGLSPFVKERVKRYGPISKTSFVGRPHILSTDPDLNNFVLQQEGRLVESWYPDTFEEILGRQSFGSMQGFMHKYCRNMVLHHFGPVSLTKMLHELESSAIKRLKEWSCRDTIEMKEEITSMIFDLSAMKLISYDSNKSPENLRAHFSDFTQGLNICFPFNIPGMSYHKGLQGRKNILRILKKLMRERSQNPREQQQHDFFDCVLEELKKEGTILTEPIALDLMLGMISASNATMSLVLTLAMKFLSNHPLVLQRLTEEHEAILRQRKEANSGLTWTEYKSMAYTHQIINETMRLANVIPVIFRKTLKEIQFKGYTIPEGWGVMVCASAVHLDPATYKNPTTFNPSRWEGIEVNGESKQFMAFGGGTRFCVGIDFAKLQIAVFLHYLVANYRWEVIRGGNIVRKPDLQFPDGFHIRMKEKDAQKGGNMSS